MSAADVEEETLYRDVGDDDDDDDDDEGNFVALWLLFMRFCIVLL